MTEHAAVIFVFFFLAEYGSIVLICILNTVLFLGGYLLDFSYVFILIDYIIDTLGFVIEALIYSDLPRYPQWGDSVHYQSVFHTMSNPALEGLLSGLALGIKSCAMIFTFIWVRASFPRIRFDQLMSFSWTILLPVVIAFIVLIPCIVYSFEIIPANISLL